MNKELIKNLRLYSRYNNDGTVAKWLREAANIIEAQADEIERLTDDLQIVTDHREQALNNAMVLMKENERQAALLKQCKDALSSATTVVEGEYGCDDPLAVVCNESLAAIEVWERGEQLHPSSGVK